MARSDSYARTTQRARDSADLVLRGILPNLLLAVVKFAGGVFGHTYALIADGAESLLDVLSSALVWTGFRVAARPPDADHPYGHGKAEPLAGLIVALFIFVMAGWVGLHAVHEIATPHEGPAWWTLVVLAAFSLRRPRSQGTRQHRHVHRCLAPPQRRARLARGRGRTRRLALGRP